MRLSDLNNFFKNKSVIFIILILLGSFLLKLKFVTSYVAYTDEILSAFVADSISRTWLPLLPSNYIYDRALLHHYLLAIPIGFFEVDYISMRINSIIFSLVVILAVYLLGKRISVTWVAISAAFIVSISSLFNQFALSGRMYITYSAFYTLSVFFFYQGFIRGKLTSKWLAIAFLSATILCSESGVLLGPIFIFALIIYHKTGWVRDKTIYLCCAIWFVLFCFVYYDFPNTYQPFTVHSGVHQVNVINAQMPLREIIGNLIYPWYALDKVLPFSMPFFLIMTILVIKKREFRQHYALVVLLPALVVGSFLTYRAQYRIIIGWLPLYVLAYCQFVNTILRWLNKERIGNKGSVGHLLSGNNLKYLWIVKRKSITMKIGVYIIIGMSIVYVNKLGTISSLWNYMSRRLKLRVGW